MRMATVWGATLALCLFAADSKADAIYRLLDHGGGSKGTNYGIRVDSTTGTYKVNTFSMEQGSASVFLKLITSGPDANTGTITGVVRHNQSGQHWSIDAVLQVHLYTHDGSDWRTNLTGDLYDAVLEDMIDNAANEFSSGEGNLKDKTFLADRLGFEIMRLEMNLIGGGTPHFQLAGQTTGNVVLWDYPQGANEIPFLFSKGHRLSASSQELVGIGWMDPRAPGDQTGSDGLTQDWLFRVGTPIPEPATLLLCAAGGLGCAVLRRRRKAS